MRDQHDPGAAPLVTRVERLLEAPGTELALGAALRARDAGAPDALVLAALLHTSGDGGLRGPRVNVAWLGQAFGPAVAEPVRLLPDAHRWLATVDRAWVEEAGLEALEAARDAGGTLEPSALRSFERRPFAQDAIHLARWIDAERREPRSIAHRPHLDWKALVQRLAVSGARVAG